MHRQDQAAFQVLSLRAQASFEQGDFANAQICLEQALTIKRHPSLYFALARLCLAQDHYAQGLAYAQQGLDLAPHSLSGWGLLGNLQRLNRQYDLALTSYQRGLEQTSDLQQQARCIFNQSLCQLAKGDYKNGFLSFLAKAQVGDDPPAPAGLAHWSDQSLVGKDLILCATEGLGDTLQWSRFLQRLESRSTTLICPVSLHRLLAYTLPKLRLAEEPNAPIINTQLTLYAPLYVLPARLDLEASQLPASVLPYLKVPPAAIQQFKQQDLIASSAAFKIGINWACNPQSPTSKRRSIPLAILAPLLQHFANNPELQFYSLQWGHARDELKQIPPDWRPIDLMQSVNDLADTAARLLDLNLVITVDSAIAHLAGALNQPCWLLLPFAHSWRWQTEQAWYARQQHFIQPEPGNWQSVVAAVTTALEQSIALPTGS